MAHFVELGLFLAGIGGAGYGLFKYKARMEAWTAQKEATIKGWSAHRGRQTELWMKAHPILTGCIILAAIWAYNTDWWQSKFNTQAYYTQKLRKDEHSTQRDQQGLNAAMMVDSPYASEQSEVVWDDRQAVKRDKEILAHYDSKN